MPPMPLLNPRVLSVIPPMTQINTPYPSTAYLTGFLRSRGVDAVQEDLALALVLRLLSKAGLDAIRAAVERLPESQRTATVDYFVAEFDRYRASVEPVRSRWMGVTAMRPSFTALRSVPGSSSKPGSAP